MIKKILLTVIIVGLNCSLLFAPPKPPVGTGGGGAATGGAGGSGPIGGGAPVDGGLTVLLLLGAIYAGSVVVNKYRKAEA